MIGSARDVPERGLPTTKTAWPQMILRRQFFDIESRVSLESSVRKCERAFA